MTDRRKFLAAAPAAAAGAVLTGSVVQAKSPEVQSVIDTAQRDAFPEATVFSQFGEKLNFYNDLIKDKIVMVNFMTIQSEEQFPMSQFMASVADNLGDKLGKSVFINSITLDPKSDTPKDLLAFAKKVGLREGWRFLTTTPSETMALSTRLYRHPPHNLSGKAKKVDIVFYGNGGAGLWGTFPTGISPADAASRISWVMPKERSAELRRAGPRPLDAAGPMHSTNRDI